MTVNFLYPKRPGAEVTPKGEPLRKYHWPVLGIWQRDSMFYWSDGRVSTCLFGFGSLLVYFVSSGVWRVLFSQGRIVRFVYKSEDRWTSSRILECLERRGKGRVPFNVTNLVTSVTCLPINRILGVELVKWHPPVKELLRCNLRGQGEKSNMLGRQRTSADVPTVVTRFCQRSRQNRSRVNDQKTGEP